MSKESRFRKSSLKNYTATLSSYCFITLATIELENVHISHILNFRVFGNTLIANGKYYLPNRKTLPQPIQPLLSKKQKNLSEFSASHLNSTSNFGHFEKEDDHHSLCISDTRDCGKRG